MNDSLPNPISDKVNEKLGETVVVLQYLPGIFVVVSFQAIDQDGEVLPASVGEPIVDEVVHAFTQSLIPTGGGEELDC